MLRQKGKDGGRAALPSLPPSRSPVCAGARGKERGVPAVAERGAPGPGRMEEGRAGHSTGAVGPGLPRLQLRGRGRGSSQGGSRGTRGLRGARRAAVPPRGPGRWAGPGRGRGGARRGLSVFCGRNSLERRQWSGMFTAGGKTISNSSGEMCHPNVTGKLT